MAQKKRIVLPESVEQELMDYINIRYAEALATMKKASPNSRCYVSTAGEGTFPVIYTATVTFFWGEGSDDALCQYADGQWHAYRDWKD